MNGSLWRRHLLGVFGPLVARGRRPARQEDGGMGPISGRKAFQKPMKDGVELLNAIQDVYLCKEVTVA